MTASQKLKTATQKLKKAGFDVRNPDHDPDGKKNIRWIFAKPGSDTQIGCIHPSSEGNGQVHAYFEF